MQIILVGIVFAAWAVLKKRFLLADAIGITLFCFRHPRPCWWIDSSNEFSPKRQKKKKNNNNDGRSISFLTKVKKKKKKQ